MVLSAAYLLPCKVCGPGVSDVHPIDSVGPCWIFRVAFINQILAYGQNEPQDPLNAYCGLLQAGPPSPQSSPAPQGEASLQSVLFALQETKKSLEKFDPSGSFHVQLRLQLALPESLKGGLEECPVLKIHH